MFACDLSISSNVSVDDCVNISFPRDKRRFDDATALACVCVCACGFGERQKEKVETKIE